MPTRQPSVASCAGMSLQQRCQYSCDHFEAAFAAAVWNHVECTFILSDRFVACFLVVQKAEAQCRRHSAAVQCRVALRHGRIDGLVSHEERARPLFQQATLLAQPQQLADARARRDRRLHVHATPVPVEDHRIRDDAAVWGQLYFVEAAVGLDDLHDAGREDDDRHIMPLAQRPQLANAGPQQHAAPCFLSFGRHLHHFRADLVLDHVSMEHVPEGMWAFRAILWSVQLESARVLRIAGDIPKQGALL
mmetsp:Transcript_78285/g.199032  ORF Transcript_78285/g.199032 Transcript_78285/m.199032 type:complete len:248 (-) Transcript_78285:383-1126(-)